MRRLVKVVAGSDRVRVVLCWLMSCYIRLVRLSGRWETVGGAEARALWDAGRPFILAFWHGRILMMPHVWRRGVPIHMLISKHRDGLLIARTVSHFGIDTVAGSSSRGGGAALRTMLKALKAGQCVGITPDGPRGPRMRASEGVVQIARLSGAPVIPATFSTARGRVLNSWDRFLVAFPFTRGVFVWGAPVHVPRDAEDHVLDAKREEIEAALIRITHDADLRMGRAPVPPADPQPSTPASSPALSPANQGGG